MQVHPPETDGAVPGADVKAGRLTPGQSLWRRKVFWLFAVPVVLALLVLTPPLVNANRYRSKIAESMSKSLGRPVHLDNVSLHLLPTPGFTLQNLVVSEDPAFGAEPTIRANVVEATLRVSSLWHHPVEFSTVRFVEPSVNLVRNAQGRWNLSDVLLNASHVESAPTAQRKAGPKPRFPYIEATGGRVNVKLGVEKLPFSLTDADFALWLPSAQTWRVRLIGHPARTDTNITDPGRLRFEGELRRAATVAQVPVDFQATWHDAPLGEATRILAGDDWGWRGTANVDASLTGTLGEAHLTSKLTLGGLRRSEFFPAHPLDLQITCDSAFMLHPATISQMHCSLPDDAPQPMVFQAATLPLQNPRATEATVQGAAVPMRWALLWAALFSPRVPTDLPSAGTLDLNLIRNAQGSGSAPLTSARETATSSTHRAGWTGTVRLAFPQPDRAAILAPAAKNVLTATMQPAASAGGWPSLEMPATPVVLGEDAAVNLSGGLSETGYTFALSGSAPADALLKYTPYLPSLGDDLDSALRPVPAPARPADAATQSSKVQVSCERIWGQPQHCSEAGHEATTPVAQGRSKR